jgi:acyl-CoA synthetase (AMP-forming)/AMP-acid ligase II
VFEAPTVEGVAARLPEGGLAHSGALTLIARDGPLPLSLGQRRIWFIEQLEPGRSTYHMPAAIRLRGHCDAGALAASFSDLVQRHEALRTRFSVHDGEPHQDIVPTHACTFALSTEDLRHFPVVEREALARARTAEEVAGPFDLTNGPLVRARLLRLDEQDHLLVFVIHHIVSDGWTMGLITRELTELYAARAAGRTAALLPLSIHYVDFATWQRAHLSDEALRPALAFWKKYLAGGVAAEIPSDRPRPRVLDGQGREYRFTWSAELTEALQHLGQREGATLFMTLLAGYYALLVRYTRQDDMVVGTSVANRPHPEFEGVVGFFVNLLPVRVDTSGNPTFIELLARVKQACLAGYAHQDTPFESLVDAVAPGRDQSRTPIFQTMLVLLNVPAATARLGDLEIAHVPTGNHTAKFDLTLLGTETAGELGWVAEYRTELYSEATIARLADSYQTLLTAIVAQPELPVTRLPLLAARERPAVLALGGGATPDFSTDESLGSWFSRQAALAPASVAVICNGAGLTYRELDARSNQLARYLRRFGVESGSRIGLCLDRSCELIVGILGILKVGAAYVPLDPSYPQERLGFMVGDSGIAALVTCGASAGIEHARRIDLAAQADAIAAESADAFSVGSGPDDAAYVIYTSGSTGRPKGCVVTHGNVTRLMRATEPWYGFGVADAWTLFHSYAFDFSVWEIWGALLYGGRLVVVPYAMSRDPGAFHDLLAAERITVLNQTPSAFRQLIAVDRERPNATLALRYVIFGGEALELSMLQPWFDRHGDDAPQVINMYGITETTVHVTYRRIRIADVAAGKGSVIGERIPDLTLFVVDDQLEPQPVGVPGELLVGGAGLALGYLNRPELTNERFIANPFGTGRVYRSGDLARWLPDGDLEYLGRIDQQVKIRGFRIEPGEIERVVAAMPGVRECAVTVREEKAGDKKLIAFIVRQPESAEPNARAARDACRARLADYMVPAAFVFLDRFPLTAHGKLDRRALPATDAGETATADYVAPRDADETAVAAIWSEVLGRDGLGVTDDFFDLGGHSLIATQVMTRLRERCSVSLPLRVLFEQTTVEAFAAAVRKARAGTDRTAPAAGLRRASRERRKVVVQGDGEIGAVELARDN